MSIAAQEAKGQPVLPLNLCPFCGAKDVLAFDDAVLGEKGIPEEQPMRCFRCGRIWAFRLGAVSVKNYE